MNRRPREANRVTIAAAGQADLALVRQLFTEYQTWLGVDLGFQDFQRELASLPGRYAPPAGCLLLAIDSDKGDGNKKDGDKVAGIVCLRPLEHGICEMKRLFVRPGWRRRGLGRQLAVAVIGVARQQGYRVMKLDTLARLVAAETLYRSLGFAPTEAYCANPLDGAIYMALDLAGC